MLSVKRKGEIWKNWSHSVVAKPKTIFKPENLEQLISFVTQCAEERMTIRVVGAGHSFTPLVATSEALVSLDYLSGIDHVNKKEQLVTVWAGTRLKDIGPMLHEHGFAMENLGDINEQSVAGAISTGTHGTGIQFKSISNQIHGVTLLTATGKLLEISRHENEHYFEAARLSLGMLGIIVKITLKVVPSYGLKENSFKLSLNEGLYNLEQLKRDNRNFEFFWFPYTETIQVKTLNITDEIRNVQSNEQTFKKLVIENGLFWVLSEMSRNIPATSKIISKVSALGIPTGEESNESYLQYATPRLVRFNEMEYSVPDEAMAEVIRAIERMLQKKRVHVHFPLECRFVKGDSVWLSPSFERNSAYIAAHMYKGMEFSKYFKEVEEIFLHFDGRPHWGKMHTLNFTQLQHMYPKLDEFLKVRNELDPEGLFLNEYLRSLFDIY